MRTATFICCSLTLLLATACQPATSSGSGDEKTADAALSEALSASPRHHEWVDLPRDSGNFKAFVVYPESSIASKAVIVIHENRGLNDWARSFADLLAGNGFLVIAPDLISNTVSGKEKTSDFANSDKAREAIYALNPEQVTADLNAAYDYIRQDAASTGEVAVVGFCWGGSQTFRYATNNPALAEACVFYGTAPEEATALQRIDCPVYGFYGGEDNRVNATLEATEASMQAYGKQYEYEIYEGAGHAFMRRGAMARKGPNREAHHLAWSRLLGILN